MRGLLAVVTLLFGSQFAYGDTYTYVLERFQSSLDQCEEQGAMVAESFGALTGRETLDQSCVLSGAGIYKLVIGYQAEEAVKVAANLPPDLPLHQRPLYDDMTSCRSALEDEAAVLISQTELPLLSAYCQHIPVDLALKYSPQVAVWGASEVRGRVSSFPLDGRVRSYFPENLADRFAARGAVVRQVFASDINSMQQIINLHYYSSQSLGLAWNRPRPIAVADWGACEEAQQGIAAAFEDSTLWYLTATCSSLTREASRAELRVIHDQNPYLNHLRSRSWYDSLLECQEARDRLERRQQEIASEDAVGFCVKEGLWRGYRVHLLVQ